MHLDKGLNPTWPIIYVLTVLWKYNANKKYYEKQAFLTQNDELQTDPFQANLIDFWKNKFWKKRRNMISHLRIILILASFLFGTTRSRTLPESGGLRLKIIHINDIHAHIEKTSEDLTRWVKQFESNKKSCIRAVVVVQLVEWSFPNPEVRCSVPVIGKNLGILNLYFQL